MWLSDLYATVYFTCFVYFWTLYGSLFFACPLNKLGFFFFIIYVQLNSKQVIASVNLPLPFYKISVFKKSENYNFI